MTGLIIGTFFISGVHTALWLPRALKMRRERKKTKAASAGDRREESAAGPETGEEGKTDHE